MALPSPSWSVVNVHGTYRNPGNGMPLTGAVEFTFPTRVVSTVDGVIFPAGTVLHVDLDAFGSFSVNLPCVDDPDISPLEWVIKVQEIFGGAKGNAYNIQPRLAMVPFGLDLVTISQSAQYAEPAAQLIRGVPGGVAALNAQGNVIDSGGNTLLRVADLPAAVVGDATVKEWVQDTAADMLNGSMTGITVVYNDSTGKITLAVPTPTQSTDTEAVQDVIGAMVAAAGGTYNDVANTITLPATSSGTGTFDAESVRDAIAAAMGGSGYVSVVSNDAADTITISTTTSLQTVLDGKANVGSVVDLLSAQTIDSIKTFTKPPLVLPLPTLSSNSQLVHKKYVDDLIASVSNAGTQGSVTGTQVTADYVPAVDRDILNVGFTRRSVYTIPKEQLKNYVFTDTDAVKLAAITNNNSRAITALKAYPNRIIEFDGSTGEAWPLQLDVDEYFDAGNWTTKIPVRLKGRFKQPRGTFISKDEADAWKNTGSNPNGRVPGDNVININRVWGAPQSLGALSGVIMGPNAPAWYLQSQQVTKAPLSVVANYSGWATGEEAVVCSNDSYDFAVRAGYSANNVWKAQKVFVAAIGIDVANYTIAAASTANVNAGRSAMTPNGTNNGMETRQIKGASSLVTALVQGDTGASQLLFQSLPAPFTVGEQLIDVQTNQPIGTVGAQYLLLNGKLYNSYLTTPEIRKVPKNLPVVMDIEVEADGNVDDFIPGYNRASEVGMAGTYDHAVKIKIRSGYGRGVTVTSSFRGVIDVTVSGLPNHALENELSQDAYGYGVATAGCTEDLDIRLDVVNVRHGFSTNVLGGTWHLGANGSTDASNYVKYGTTRNCRISGTIRATFGAGIDTHEGAEGLIIENFRVSHPFWGGRILSAGVGVNTRGMNTIIRNGVIEDVKIGIFDSSQSTPIDAGLKRSDTYISNVLVDGYQLYGYCTNDDVAAGQAIGAARTYLDSCVFRGDTDITTATYTQAGIMANRAWVMSRDCLFQSSNSAQIIHKGTSTTETPKQRGGVGIHIDPIFDFTEGTGNTCVRYETHMDTAAVIDQTILAFGPNRPGFIFRHEVVAPDAGQLATKVQWAGRRLVQLGTSDATPVLNQQNQGSTATAVRMADPGEGSGGGSAATHSIAVLPTVAAGTGISTGGAPSGCALNQADIVSTDLYGEVKFGSGPSANIAGDPLFTVTFGTPFTTVPIVDLQPGNALTGQRGVPFVGVVDVTTTGFTARLSQLIPANAVAAAYRLIYQVTGV